MARRFCRPESPTFASIGISSTRPPQTAHAEVCAHEHLRLTTLNEIGCAKTFIIIHCEVLNGRREASVLGSLHSSRCRNMVTQVCLAGIWLSHAGQLVVFFRIHEKYSVFTVSCFNWSVKLAARSILIDKLKIPRCSGLFAFSAASLARCKCIVLESHTIMSLINKTHTCGPQRGRAASNLINVMTI